MAKVTSKATLVLGTNYKYHLVDFQGIDIVVDATGGNITSTTTDFTASSETAGIVKRAIEIGDVVKLSNTSNASNEGVTATVTAVAANSLAVTFNGSPVDEVAGSDINITAFKKTYQFLEAGGLSLTDGVSGLVWASKTVDDWDATDLDIYDPIYTSIEPRAKSIASTNGWEPHDTVTLKAIKDTALEVRPDANSAATKIYALPRSGNTAEATDQFTYWPNTQAALDAPLVAVNQGFINELVLIFDSVNAIDNRGVWNFRCLEPGKTHLQEQITMEYAEIYPVNSQNGFDPKLADGAGSQLVSDATVGAGGVYANILTYQDIDSQYDGDVDSVLYSFLGYVDADSQANQDVHTKIHYLLRQPTNINSDVTGPDLRGDKQPPITTFLGDQMTVDQYYLLNYNDAERNNLRVVDDSGNTQSWPQILTLTVVGDSLAIGGTFSVIHEDTFGASSVTYLQNDSSLNQKDVVITSAVNIVVPYSTYNVDGHPAGTPLPLRISYNRPGFIEPRNGSVTLSGSNVTFNISSIADPSYTAA